jgi:hypothetical protein
LRDSHKRSFASRPRAVAQFTRRTAPAGTISGTVRFRVVRWCRAGPTNKKRSLRSCPHVLHGNRPSSVSCTVRMMPSHFPVEGLSAAIGAEFGEQNRRRIEDCPDCTTQSSAKPLSPVENYLLPRHRDEARWIVRLFDRLLNAISRRRRSSARRGLRVSPHRRARRFG